MIEVTNVSKSFGTKLIFRNVYFTVTPKSRFFIIGKSGTGKSVLMKLLIGLLPADAGEIKINDLNTTHFTEKEWNKIREKFGVVFQGAALFDSINILHNVGIRLFEQKKYNSNEIEARVIDALEKVGLSSEILLKLPSELSGGMRKRVGVARAIIHEPEYIFYDEPLAGLDPVNSEMIDELIVEIAVKTNSTSIIISHDMYSVKKIATDVLLIHEGEQIFYGTRDEYFSSSHPVIQQFLARKI